MRIRGRNTDLERSVPDQRIFVSFTLQRPFPNTFNLLTNIGKLIEIWVKKNELTVIKDILNTNDAFQELLASNRYGSIEKQGSGIGCSSGFASFNTQMECVKQIVPKMVDEQRKVPMRRNSRFAAADPDKLQGLNAIKVVRKPLISTKSITNNCRIS